VLQAVRLLRSPFYTPRVGWFLTILVLAALTNIDAGWLLATGNLDWVMILIACLGLQAETNRARAAQTAAKCVPRRGALFQQPPLVRQSLGGCGESPISD
jgi:hypothetical protein